MEKNKPLTKEEIFVCQMTWGCIPLMPKSKTFGDFDVVFIRDSKLFQEKWERFQNGELNELFELHKRIEKYDYTGI